LKKNRIGSLDKFHKVHVYKQKPQKQNAAKEKEKKQRKEQIKNI
jgi:hypothetical protein